MNLLDSHDTERLLWTLTPGAETARRKEQNAANVAEGKQRLRLASLIQFTVPGAPTVYYGDEVGVTGDDDPDDRRTYPWAERGGSPDTALARALHGAGRAARGRVRRSTTATSASLLADDAAGTVAYGRKTATQAAIVALNRSDAARTLDVPLAGYVPDGTSLARSRTAARQRPRSSRRRAARHARPARAARVLATARSTSTPPAAPTGLAVDRRGRRPVSLAWNAVGGAAGVRRLPQPALAAAAT